MIQNMNDKKNNTLSERFKKGEGFVQSEQDYITFMEINEIEQSTSSIDICIVTWYSLDKKGMWCKVYGKCSTSKTTNEIPQKLQMNCHKS